MLLTIQTLVVIAMADHDQQQLGPRGAQLLQQLPTCKNLSTSADTRAVGDHRDTAQDDIKGCPKHSTLGVSAAGQLEGGSLLRSARSRKQHNGEHSMRCTDMPNMPQCAAQPHGPHQLDHGPDPLWYGCCRTQEYVNGKGMSSCSLHRSDHSCTGCTHQRYTGQLKLGQETRATLHLPKWPAPTRPNYTQLCSMSTKENDNVNPGRSRCLGKCNGITGRHLDDCKHLFPGTSPRARGVSPIAEPATFEMQSTHAPQLTSRRTPSSVEWIRRSRLIRRCWTCPPQIQVCTEGPSTRPALGVCVTLGPPLAPMITLTTVCGT